MGGPIIAPGAPTVLIEFLPAARMTDMVTCVGPPDMIMMGSPTVLIEFLMAARMGDPTAHGGVIVLGEPTVMIGEAGMGSPGGGSGCTSLRAAEVGAAGAAATRPAGLPKLRSFEYYRRRQSSRTIGRPRRLWWPRTPRLCTGRRLGMTSPDRRRRWPRRPVMVLLSAQSAPCSRRLTAVVVSPNKTSWVEIELVDNQGQSVLNEIYQVRMPDGSLFTGTLDGNGQARIEGIDPGTCQITFPNQDANSWQPK